MYMCTNMFVIIIIIMVLKQTYAKYNLLFFSNCNKKKKTLMTGFVLQGRI